MVPGLQTQPGVVRAPCEKTVSVKTFLASPRSELCRTCSFWLAKYGFLCTNSTKRSWNCGQSRYSPLNSGMLIAGSAKFRPIGALFSRSRFISYSSYNVWNWASSASARAAAPGVLSNSSCACLSNAYWRSRCLCRAGVTVGAFEANVNDDSNSVHLLCNCRITMSIAESALTWSLLVILMLAEVRLGAFGSPLPVGMLSRKIF